MVKKRGLGKSLDALLAYTHPEVITQSEQSVAGTEKLTQLPITHILPGKYQPRRTMDPQALEELANSIRIQGIIQPLIVRPVGAKYELIAGERRWRAAQQIGLTTVPAIVRAIPDEAAIAIALIENIQRADLNPIEEAIALQRLIEEFGMTHHQIAETVGKSRASVTNLLRLLSLPHAIKERLEIGLLEMGHARALLTLPEKQQLEVTEHIISKKLSVRETESLVRRLQTPMHPASTKPLDPDIVRLQDTLSAQFKLRVAVQCNQKGKGKIVIHYRNLRELDKLLEQLKGEVSLDE